MKITVAQQNPVVGDISGNLQRIKDTLIGLESGETDLLVFPELFLVGYPPRDLLERSWFIKKVQKAVHELVKFTSGYPERGVLFGAPLPSASATGKGLYNSAILIHNGKVLLNQHKSLLPTYDVFDEARYFDPAEDISTVRFKDETLGIAICEDAWNDPELWLKRMYPFDPMVVLANKGASLFLNISASPFQVGKESVRFNIIKSHARKHGIPFAFVNQVGANDELIFDGRSMCVDANGHPIEVFPSFEEKLQTVDMSSPGVAGSYEPQKPIESVHDALVLGVRDYMWKCGFKKAVLGLSGGIDSAVVCSLAAEAIGAENILGITMPGPFSSGGSVSDSEGLAKNLGVDFKEVSIKDIYSSYIHSLEGHFQGREPDEAEENIQARIRGNILMAFSNKFGSLVLSTGNKSELAVGYCTLYGDMSGGLSVISDVPKTMVYDLARFINRSREIIPNEIIEKPPSAELKPDQVDQDTLPDYEILDAILNHYVDEGLSIDEISSTGFDDQTVRWVARTVNRNEYKRRQAAQGLKVTSKAFGVGRRMPVAARY